MRAVVALALATQISVSAWLDEDARTIETAWDLIDERENGGRSRKRETFGRVMGG